MAPQNGGRTQAGNTAGLPPPPPPPRLRKGVDQGVGGHRQGKTMFKLRALRAPMYDARTGKKYREVRLVPGRIHTFGRSRSSCDVVFSDARVSRQHCQVYWDNISNQLFVFEGAPSGILLKSGNVPSSSMILAPGKIKPSLNGLYVDGKKMAHGGCRVLNPGSEVSLIASTKEARPVDDPEFGDAVGFFVEVVDLCEQNSLCPLYPAQVGMQSLRNHTSDQPEKRSVDHPPLPTYRRKRPLVHCKQGTRESTDDKSSLTFERRATSYSSTARVEKKPKRSTSEIMGLLRCQATSATSASTKFKFKEQRLGEDNNKILEGLERALDNMGISGECAAKISPWPDVKVQDKEMHFEGSSRSRKVQDKEMLFEGSSRSTKVLDKEMHFEGSSRIRVIDDEAATPAHAGMSLTKPTTDDLVRVLDSQAVTRPPEDRVTRVSPSAGDTMDQVCQRGEEDDDGGKLDAFATNVTRLAQENVSDANAGVLNGTCSGSGILLNRLKDMEVASHQTVSLQELLNPTDDLLGIFVATFTSDILWFLSSHNISTELPVTVACHDYERCWSKSEESRASSPFANWPNVNVVYPPFPDSCCFSTEKRQGIGCHHPKIFLLSRKNNIRVIVTSANLTRSQWLHVTNSVWWQDFPRSASRDYETLFCKTGGMDENGLIPKQTQSDFAMHLSSFVASLVAEVPSAAHWALDLAEFDFSSAGAALVTSVPGLYGCPCPPVPSSIRDVVKEDLVTAADGVVQTRKFLAAVNSSVVGISHRFKDSADPCGKRVRALAAILNSTNSQEGGMLTVQLERVTNVTADPNAVSVIVSSDTSRGGMGRVAGKDFLQTTGDSPSSTPSNSVHIGFLPRTVAKWVAPLYDNGLCTFSASIQPNEVLSVASGVNKKVAQLVLYVFEGRSFSLLSASELSLQQTLALCGLLRYMERPLGLRRLDQILSKFNWLDSAETNFIFGSSSIGTSLDAAFLAAFSVAAGKRAKSSNSSEESDSQWGAWTSKHEANAPSIGVVFPTIERVKAAKGGPSRHQGILCFAQSTWERLKTACLLHDAIPFPAEREGIPMHVKVAQRRFQNHPREAPYGWIYCGSHNFSPAAWGRPNVKAAHPCKCRKTTLGCTLFISNYEVGLIFVEPPPPEGRRKLQFKPLTLHPNLDESNMEPDLDNKQLGLDKFVLPFSVPAPKYADEDQPATKRAMYSAMERWRSQQLLSESGLSEDSEIEMASSETDEEDESHLCLESEENMQLEEKYGGILWSQIDSETLIPKP